MLFSTNTVSNRICGAHDFGNHFSMTEVSAVQYRVLKVRLWHCVISSHVYGARDDGKQIFGKVTETCEQSKIFQQSYNCEQ